MRTKITDNWEVELTNNRGDTLTLKGEWYVDFFRDYDNKQLIIANVVGRSEQLVCYCGNEKEKDHRMCYDCWKSKRFEA